MSGMDREAFLARVRAALDESSGQRGDPQPPATDQSIARLAGPEDDLPALFAARAEAVGMRVQRTTRGDLRASLAQRLRDIGAGNVVLSAAADSELLNTMRDALADAGAAPLDWSAAPGLSAHFDADAGVTDVSAAIAESGTLVLCSGPGRSRGAFLVPPVHVAVVPASAIVPDLIDYWQTAREPPTATVLVTGPSKTADIEGILVTGVHGPGAVHVLLVEDA